jgi:hypothetical protein
MRDIEIELLQGAVTRDDLGQSVQNVRRFQNQVRGEALDTTARPDYRAIANRQFQVNDMLLTLLQEMATRQRSLELQVHKAVQQDLWPVADLASASAPERALPELADLPATLAEDDLVRRLTEIENAMRDDAITLPLEVSPQETPLVGKAIGGLRTALHSLVVFYANRMAAKQTEINRLYGDNLRRLLEDTDKLHDAVNALHAENAALRARLDALVLPPTQLD